MVAWQAQRLLPLQRCRSRRVCDMTKTALSALIMAWITTMIATSFLVVALMLSRIWDSGIYFAGLQRVLSSNL